MGRMIPYDCPHGVTVDWGDFGPTNVAGEGCAQCGIDPTYVCDVCWDVCLTLPQARWHCRKIDIEDMRRRATSAQPLELHSMLMQALDALEAQE